MNNCLDTNFVHNVIKNYHLSGVSGFLDFAANDYAELQVYGEKAGIKLPPTKRVLFHGSKSAFERLKPPRHCSEYQASAVYATNLSDYAIFVACINVLDSGHGNVEMKDKLQCSVDIDFVNGASNIKNGYVNIVSDEFFKFENEIEQKSAIPIDVLFSIKVIPSDINLPINIDTIGHRNS